MNKKKCLFFIKVLKYYIDELSELEMNNRKVFSASQPPRAVRNFNFSKSNGDYYNSNRNSNTSLGDDQDDDYFDNDIDLDGSSKSAYDNCGPDLKKAKTNSNTEANEVIEEDIDPLDAFM